MEDPINDHFGGGENVTHEELVVKYTAELAEIDTAVSAFLSSGGVTEHTAGSRRIRRDEMAMLYKRKRELENILVLEEIGTNKAIASWAKR